MDYRDKQPVLLALFRGLSCPFCRRQMSQLAVSAERLERHGVATLAVVATVPERTRLYYRFGPPRFRVAADPDLRTHRAYGLPRVPRTPAVMQSVEAAAARWPVTWGLPPHPVRRAPRFSASTDSSRSRATGKRKPETETRPS